MELKLGLEIELMAYQKSGNVGFLGSDFNRFRKSFGNTVNFKYFDGYPRFNSVDNYSFLSNEGIRYYLESPRAIEVVTPPIVIDGTGRSSKNSVNLLKQGLNNVLKHYSHLDFVPYSIHLNVSSLGSEFINREFWNLISPMSLFLGSNSLSSGVGIRFHNQNCEGGKLGNRLEVLIDGESILFENQLELLCKFYEQTLISSLGTGVQNLYLTGVKDIDTIKSLFEMSGDLTTFTEIYKRMPFSNRILDLSLKKSKSITKVGPIEFGLMATEPNYSSEIFWRTFISRNGCFDFKTLMDLEIDNLEYEQDNQLFLNEEIEFLNLKNSFESDRGFDKYHREHFLNCLDYLEDESIEINSDYDSFEFGDVTRKLIERSRYFERMKKHGLVSKGKLAPKKFNSIDYSVVLNLDNLFEDVEFSKSSWGKMTEYGEKIVAMDWNNVYVLEDGKIKYSPIKQD